MIPSSPIPSSSGGCWFKPFLVAIASLFFLATSSCILSRQPKSKIVARINDSLITTDDLIEELQRFHLDKMRPGQESLAAAARLDLRSFVDELIDRKLFIQEARRMGLDRDRGFLAALADEQERICLELLRQDKIVKPSSSLSQQDVDNYFRAAGHSPRRLSDLSRAELQKVRRKKEEELSRAYIQELKKRAKIEIFTSRIADLMSLKDSNLPVARVNGEDILGRELFAEIGSGAGEAAAAGRGGEKAQDLAALQVEQGLCRLIEHGLLRQEAYQLGYADRKEVKKHMQRYEEDILFSRFYQKLITPKVQVKSEEIERYFRENASSLRTKLMVCLDEITTLDPNSAWEIYRELRQGADFGFLASQQEAKLLALAAQAGGEAGRSCGERWIAVQDIQPELQSLILDLKEGEISAPVRLGDRYFIFRVREKRGGEQIPLEQVRSQIEQKIAATYARLVAKELARRLRAVSKVAVDERSLKQLTF
ncbi:MAG: peptidyl-prolyl cis-trans isomerase [bacterium]|nr:peptidyl-prolyl cis-trans isomerase [bacterium]